MNKTVSKAFDTHFGYSSVQKHSSTIFVRELLRELRSCKVHEKFQKASIRLSYQNVLLCIQDKLKATETKKKKLRLWL